MAELTIYADQSVYVDRLNPSTSFNAENTIYAAADSAAKKVSFFHIAYPVDLDKKQITNNVLKFYQLDFDTDNPGSGGWYNYFLHRSELSESQINWNSKNLELIRNLGAYSGIEWHTGWFEFQLSGLLDGWIRIDEVQPYTSFAVASSRHATYKPNVVVTYVDAVPLAKNPYPASGFINKATDNTFGWTFSAPSNTFGTLSQASAVFRWKPVGGVATEIAISDATNTVTIPADTFSTDIEWQVVVTSDDGISSESTTWHTLTIVDSTPSVPINLSPKAIFVDGDVINRFSWEHVVSTGSAQSKFDLDYSTDGATWTPITSGTTDEYYDVPASTLPAGTVYWRVRTYNTDNVAGDYSTANIVVQAAPAAPTIKTTTTTPKPTITWESVGQQGYQVKTGGYDSGTMYGTAKTFQIPAFLTDGAHEISVRVINSFSLWSNWATVTVNVTNTAQAAITVAAQAVQNGVALTWAGTHTSFIVYRDGVQIASQTATTFTDYLTNATHKYQIRGVVGDNYALSNEVSGTPTITSAAIAVIGDYDWLQLVCLRGQKPSLNITQTHDIVYQHYSRRVKPVSEKSDFVDRTGNFSFSFRTKADAEKFRSMGGETVVYKDSREILIGVLNEAPSSIDSIAWDVSGTIVEVDYEGS